MRLIHHNHIMFMILLIFSFYIINNYSLGLFKISKGFRFQPLRSTISMPVIPNFMNHIIPNRLQNTTLLNKVAEITNISPPWNAPSFIWTLVWRFHTFLMPFLHAFDDCSVKDKCCNLAVLWWKAISGCRWGTKTYDNGVAFDLLPPKTRHLVRFPFSYLYPNLHHQNVAIRTVFLDEAIKEELAYIKSSCQCLDTKVIVLGTGFDTRSLRFLQQENTTTTFHEFDLPAIIEQKNLIFNRYRKRRSHESILFPQLYGVDLNDPIAVKMHLEDLYESNEIIAKEYTRQYNPKSNHHYHNKKCGQTIFVIEAVMIYLKQDMIKSLLHECIQAASAHSSHVSICFADRLPNIVSSDRYQQQEYNEAENFFDQLNMKLVKWICKNGRARHLGVARLK